MCGVCKCAEHASGCRVCLFLSVYTCVDVHSLYNVAVCVCVCVDLSVCVEYRGLCVCVVGYIPYCNYPKMCGNWMHLKNVNRPTRAGLNRGLGDYCLPSYLPAGRKDIHTHK